QVFQQDAQYDIAFTCSHDAERRFGVLNRSLKHALEARFRTEGLTVARDTRGFDIVMVGDTVRDPRRYGETLLCFVNHGTGIKNILYRNLRAHMQTRYHIFVEGDYRLERIRQAGVQGVSSVYKVGLPKLDPLFRPAYPCRETILEQLGLDPTKPTVLFAPTYKPTCIDAVREQILSQTQGYNLIIKLHQYSWRGKYAPHWHHTLYERVVTHYSHAVLIPVDDYNILPYLHAADTLISEASSTMFDFLALDKIGIIFVLPPEQLRHHDGEALLSEDPEMFLADAFIHIKHPLQIGAAIDAALQDNPERRQAARKYRDHLFVGLDGHASMRVKDTIEQLLAEGGHTHRP
ncbi:MAG: CDP-glycerol glycerophosphotransferase family protein, partial [bacterium]|nr:CDP-glycerol glycerophosphotransferase family protein [bacterium]